MNYITIEVLFKSGVSKRYSIKYEGEISDKPAEELIAKMNTISYLSFEDAVTGMHHYVNFEEAAAVSQV